MSVNANLSALQQEWMTLQNQFDSYEKHSLFIKLFNIAVSCTLLLVLNNLCWALLVCAVLWLQDGIWKTFQARIGERIDVVELAIQHKLEEQPTSVLGMQFNSAWQQSRPNAVGLVMEYIKHSLKPTVAYPHLILFITIVVESQVF